MVATSGCHTCFDSQTSVRNVCLKKLENKGQNFEAFGTLFSPEIAKHVPIKLCAREKINEANGTSLRGGRSWGKEDWGKQERKIEKGMLVTQAK